MYNEHQRILKEQSAEEMHTALKSCNELGQAQTLQQLFLDLQKTPNSKIPSQASVHKIKNDRSFNSFLNKVIVCTEPGYIEGIL